MEFKSVTPEEYNTTLRASVNAYYQHAMNDPNMSQEEAIESTAQMSERYHEAVEEFNNNAEVSAQNSITSETGVENGPDGSENGPDGPGNGPDGPDGGMDGPSE